MITVAVPSSDIADAVGDLGDGVAVVVWDADLEDAPDLVRDTVNLACLPHYSGGRKVYSRLAQCPELKVIQIPSAGYEHALPFVPQGVALANARGVHDARVAEMALALVLASRRLIPQFVDAQSRRAWEPVYFTPGVADSRALIIGYGSIGKAIGSRLRACEVHVEGVGRAARVDEDGTVVHGADQLLEVVGGFDIVIAVTPFDSTTDRLVNAELLAAMPDQALLVNVGRGKVVDTDALVAELQSGRLWAALDVTEPEPLPKDHPLWASPRCLIVPHVAGGESLTNRRYTDLVRAQALALASGEPPLNVVNT